MPIRLNDRQLASAYGALEARRRADPSVQIDDAQVLHLLAAVGDTLNRDAGRLLQDLSAPGVTREQQVALIKQGMDDGEKADLAAILDGGTVPIAAPARNFLEAVLDRTPVEPGAPLRITGNQRDGIAGVTTPGATIEAINISTAPGGRLHMDDTMEIGRADSWGKFQGRMPDVQEGDLIRVRARKADGSRTDWVTVKATGIADRDTRNAVVAIFRIGMADAGSGKVSATNINASRQVSEPGARLQFTNDRTGERTVAVMDETGSFPAGFTLNGRAGDAFTVAASDGVNNLDFAESVGKVTVPGGDPGTEDLVPDPALHRDELNADGTPRFTKKRFTGPLFKDGASPEDVQQGQIGDCYFPSALAALAKAQPDAIHNMIRENGDGTYTVTFKEKDWATGRYKDVPIKVDGDLYVRSWGGPLYGAAAGPDKGERTMELWFPLVEKAYAQWKGSFDAIGNGGLSSQVFEDILGRDGQDLWISSERGDAVWNALKAAVDRGSPVSAGTYGHEDTARYANSGVYGDHSYSVLGYEVTDGERYVRLRNPWGESEPSPGDGTNDGNFRLKLADFTRLYQSLMYTN